MGLRRQMLSVALPWLGQPPVAPPLAVVAQALELELQALVLAQVLAVAPALVLETAQWLAATTTATPAVGSSWPRFPTSPVRNCAANCTGTLRLQMGATCTTMQMTPCRRLYVSSIALCPTSACTHWGVAACSAGANCSACATAAASHPVQHLPRVTAAATSQSGAHECPSDPQLPGATANRATSTLQRPAQWRQSARCMLSWLVALVDWLAHTGCCRHSCSSKWCRSFGRR